MGDSVWKLGHSLRTAGTDPTLKGLWQRGQGDNARFMVLEPAAPVRPLHTLRTRGACSSRSLLPQEWVATWVGWEQETVS